MSSASSETRAVQPFIGELDPRVRVVTSGAFAILLALSESFTTLSLGLLLALSLLIAAGIAYWQTCRKFLELNLFILFLLIFLPFSYPGEPLFTLGGLAWSLEGALKAIKIALKANSIMLTFAALISTLEPNQVGLALDRLGSPAKLTHLLFFAIRYLDVIQREYGRLIKAMKLRCFRPGFTRHTFKTYGYLVGMLLIRSLDRSERILNAMKCRGFQHRFYTLTTLTMTKSDVGFLIALGIILTVLAVIEWLAP
ncbi:cobalt ECF transporter T component CbiQ [candidate division KSB3 bacterium]|uniref:Cobalt ECF transporter T component CbiQ n=1 Tax=candidate division KSB3 bacterium TaxID=2044937 RepID=A0A9D5JZC9_9BACT|nr:cobalt ECF transporter T component CbiQ [candidate division KSB3 bacterium]